MMSLYQIVRRFMGDRPPPKPEDSCPMPIVSDAAEALKREADELVTAIERTMEALGDSARKQ